MVLPYGSEYKVLSYAVPLTSLVTAVCLHFWVKFKMAARGPKRVTSQVFEVSYYQINFQLSTVHNSEDRGGMKMPYDFLFTFVTFSKQTAGLEKKFYSME